jgi:hypothetical protein
MNRDALTVVVGILIVFSTLSGTVGAASTGPTGTQAGPTAQTDAVESLEFGEAERNRTPQTADEFLRAFRALQNTSAFRAYGEFEVVRTQAVISIQAGTFEDQDRRRMRLLLQALDNFSEAHRLMENESLKRSLTAANRSERTLNQLHGAGGSRYSNLAEIGLTRFYRDLGNRLTNQSRQTTRAPEEIRLLESAAVAFRKGDSPDQFARYSALAENKSAAYQRDRREMNESATAARSFLDDCGSACGSPITAIRTYRGDLFRLYDDGRRARADVSRAVALATENGLSDQASQYRQLRRSVTQTVLTLILACVAIAVGYMLVLGLPTMFVSLRLWSWARDRQAERVGSVLTSVPATEGYDASE